MKKNKLISFTDYQQKKLTQCAKRFPFINKVHTNMIRIAICDIERWVYFIECMEHEVGRDRANLKLIQWWKNILGEIVGSVDYQFGLEVHYQSSDDHHSTFQLEISLSKEIAEMLIPWFRKFITYHNYEGQSADWLIFASIYLDQIIRLPESKLEIPTEGVYRWVMDELN